MEMPRRTSVRGMTAENRLLPPDQIWESEGRTAEQSRGDCQSTAGSPIIKAFHSILQE